MTNYNDTDPLTQFYKIASDVIVTLCTTEALEIEDPATLEVYMHDVRAEHYGDATEWAHADRANEPLFAVIKYFAESLPNVHGFDELTRKACAQLQAEWDEMFADVDPE